MDRFSWVVVSKNRYHLAIVLIVPGSTPSTRYRAPVWSSIAVSHNTSLLLYLHILFSYSKTGVAPVSSHRGATALEINIPEEDMTADQREIVKIMAKWNEVRHMTKEEAAGLDDEWKAAHTRFFEKFDKDLANMEDIASKLVTMLEPPKVQKKTKSQRKRDKWAIVQARDAFRAKTVAGEAARVATAAASRAAKAVASK